MFRALFVAATCVAAGSYLQGDPAATTPPAPSETSADEKLAVDYARAQLQLASANLERVQQINRRLARTVPESVVAEYARDLQVAKVQMRQAEANTPENQFPIWLERATSVWKTADAVWRNSLAVNGRSPGTIGTLDIERFRLRAEVCRLQLARGQRLAQRHARRSCNGRSTW